MEFCLVHNQNENCHYDHIPLNLKGIRNLIFASTGQQVRGKDSEYFTCCTLRNGFLFFKIRLKRLFGIQINITTEFFF